MSNRAKEVLLYNLKPHFTYRDILNFSPFKVEVINDEENTLKMCLFRFGFVNLNGETEGYNILDYKDYFEFSISFFVGLEEFNDLLMYQNRKTIYLIDHHTSPIFIQLNSADIYVNLITPMYNISNLKIDMPLNHYAAMRFQFPKNKRNCLIY